MEGADVVLPFMRPVDPQLPPRQKANRRSWEGTASELLASLESEAHTLNSNPNSREWPNATNALTRKLNEVRPNLEDAG